MGSQGRVNVQEVMSIGFETSKGVIGDSEESRRYVVEIGDQMRKYRGRIPWVAHLFTVVKCQPPWRGWRK
jgi:hypothetical protein